MPSSVIGSAAAAIGGNILGSVLGGDTPEAPNIQTWQPQYTNSADQQWWNLSQQNQGNNPYAQYAQQFKDVFNTQYNNPYAQGAQQGANNAAAAYGQVGTNGLNAANQINQASMSMLPYAQQIMTTAMDPQSALYDRTLQQTQDQQRVGQAARGITMSPYGAGLENQALQNFNIDWQNNQLQRQTTGLDSANKAITGAAANSTTAQNMANSGAAALQQQGLLPYQTSQGIATDQYNGLTNQINAGLGTNQLNSANMAALMQYMGLGAGQSNTQAGLTQQNYMNQLQQAQTSAGGLGSLINSGLGMLGSPTGSSSMLGQAGSSLPWLSNGSNLLNLAFAL